MTRKERFEKTLRHLEDYSCYEEKQRLIWQWIEREVNEAEKKGRIEENHYWLEKEDIKKSPLAHIFVSRISELER